MGPCQIYYADRNSNIEIRDYTNSTRESKTGFLNRILKTEKLFLEYFEIELNFTIQLVEQKVTDAKIIQIDGEPGLFVNYQMVRNYDEEGLGILIAHEMFHLYHFNINPPRNWRNEIVLRLYTEGFAVLASSLIYPGFAEHKYVTPWTNSDADFLKYTSIEEEVSRTFMESISTTERDLIDKFFSGNSGKAEPWPARSGYYLGFRLLREMYLETGSVDKLFLDEEEFIQELEKLRVES